jgi:ribosomal protein L18
MGTKGLTGRQRRKLRVRKKVFGTAERPRLNVFRSAKHVYAQVIDDDKGMTLGFDRLPDRIHPCAVTRAAR